MDKDNFYDELNLTDEERKVLDKVSGRLENDFNEKMSEIMPDMVSGCAPQTPFDNKHITDYDRELFVKLDIEITALNELGTLKEIAQVVENTYHIPVPSGTNYITQIKTFIDKFDIELTDFANKLHGNENFEE